MLLFLGGFIGVALMSLVAIDRYEAMIDERR